MSQTWSRGWGYAGRVNYVQICGTTLNANSVEAPTTGSDQLEKMEQTVTVDHCPMAHPETNKMGSFNSKQHERNIAQNR